jgi:DNA polymerase I-like protein with 3'-5' exonuclease and polymerase domains
MVAQDYDSGKIYMFAPHQLESGLELLQKADRLIGHNIIGFDVPVIKKLHGVDLSDKELVDTLVMSRLFNPVREGGHSLEMWGYRLKYPKTQFEDYKNYSSKMLDYCRRDVQLNALVLRDLMKEGTGFSKECVQLEQDVSKILKEQEDSGFLFDEYKAEILLAGLREKMQATEDEVHQVFKPRKVFEKIIPAYKKDGTLSKLGFSETTKKKVHLLDEEYTLLKLGTPHFIRTHEEEFNLGSRKQIGEYLLDYGWKPARFTPTGQPIIDEGTLNKVKHIPEAKLIAEFLLLQKRVAQIDSWIESVEEDGRIHGFVISTGTITGRMSARNPNLQQVPSVKSPYGAECRSCWIVPKDYKLVGVDASGLELRMLAHYMKDKEFTDEVVNGDIHARNQKIAGLKSRGQSKNVIYAIIYGAGNKKLGQMVGGSTARGKKLRERLFADQPAFKSLGDRVTQVAKRGYLKGLDGRRINIRRNYASLNSLLQGAGATIMKKALILLYEKAKKRNLDFKFVANIHDEWQVEVHKAHAEYFGKLGVQAIKEAGEYYNLRCPLDAEYKIGDSWNDTH